MKKVLLVALFAIIALSGHAGLPFGEVNKRFNISVIGGYVGYHDPIHYGAVGASFTIFGFYIDAMGFPPLHGSDTRVDKWEDSRSFLCHVGYQIPISKAFRIIPIIGYSNISTGVTDGWDWSAGNSGVHNKYEADHSISRFDYGGVIVFKYKKAVFNIGATRSCLYGGIGIEI